MRRKEKSQSQEWCQERLKKAPYGVLSLVDSKKRPYGIPLNFVYDEEKIYIHGARSGEKVDSIDQGAKACFTVISKGEIVAEKFSTNYESVVCFGTIRPLEEKQKKVQALKMLIEKYSKDFLQEGFAYVERDVEGTQVFVLEIEEKTGKKNQE